MFDVQYVMLMEEMQICPGQVGIIVRISSEHMKWSNYQVNLWSWMSQKHNALYWQAVVSIHKA